MLSAQPGDHRWGQLDPADEDAAAAQRQGDASGPDPEFQGRAGSGQLGKQIHRRVQHRRVNRGRLAWVLRRVAGRPSVCHRAVAADPDSLTRVPR